MKEPLKSFNHLRLELHFEIMTFDDTSTMTLDTISRELIRRLPPELGNSGSETAWAKAIVNVLQKIGHENDWLVLGRRSDDDGEWLLDVVWMKKEDWRLGLAVESEWLKPTEIEADFLKLLSIKAPKKLLVFKTRDRRQTEEVIQRIQSLMLKYPYHLAGEEYMAVERRAEGAFRYLFRVPNDGHLVRAGFIDMGTALEWPWT